jgi:CRP/FNR family transcriptional regulator, cyclic AMP receptor protein
MGAKDDIVAAAIWAAELDPAEIERAKSGLQVRRFARGGYVCHRGDRLDYWTGVVTGLVKISAISKDGKPMTFAGAADGGWFGEGSVLKDEARRYDIVAVRDTELAMMPRATFMWLFENSAGFNRFLVRQFNERMGQFIATIEHDRILHNRARVARTLAWFFNPVLYPFVRNEIEISQEELALLAGLSRQIVNRSLHELAGEHLIRIEHGRIAVLDLPRLQNYDA